MATKINRKAWQGAEMYCNCTFLSNIYCLKRTGRRRDRNVSKNLMILSKKTCLLQENLILIISVYMVHPVICAFAIKLLN